MSGRLPDRRAARAARDAFRWSGHARIAAGWAVFAGSVGDHAAHAHPAIQVVLPSNGAAFSAQVAGTTVAGVDGLLIGSNVPHRLAQCDATLFYVEAASDAGHALTQACRGPWRVLPATSVQRLRSLASRPASITLARLLRALGVQPAARPGVRASVSRVDGVLERCRQRPASPASARALAAQACLSERQFSDAVRALRGMPLRPYLRWLRLGHAVEALARGEAATHAAQSAGFADAAHFSRTLQRHFGIAPGTLRSLFRA